MAVGRSRLAAWLRLILIVVTPPLTLDGITRIALYIVVFMGSLLVPPFIPVLILVMNSEYRNFLSTTVGLLPFSRETACKLFMISDVVVTVLAIVAIYLPFELLLPFEIECPITDHEPFLCLILIGMPLYSAFGPPHGQKVSLGFVLLWAIFFILRQDPSIDLLTGPYVTTCIACSPLLYFLAWWRMWRVRQDEDLFFRGHIPINHTNL